MFYGINYFITKSINDGSDVAMDLSEYCKAYFCSRPLNEEEQQAVLAVFGVAIGSAHYWENPDNVDAWFDAYLHVQSETKKRKVRQSKKKPTGKRKLKKRTYGTHSEAIRVVQDDLMGCCRRK